MITNCFDNLDVPSFIESVTRSLGTCTLDFHEKKVFIDNQKKNRVDYLAAGVCMPFYHYAGEFHVQLIKRSSKVSQPGDLSFPGGMLSPFQDNLLMSLISSGIIPVLKNNSGLKLDDQDKKTRRLMSLFLASAIRDAWEEVRLNPFNVIYLGALPAYTLKIFRRIIFPSACFITKKSRYQMNDEVDRLIHIPLSVFFNDAYYRRLFVEIPHLSHRHEEFPSLLFHDKDGNEHLLWGATFFLLMRFLKITCNFQPPVIPPERSITKILLPEYHHNH